VLVSFIRVESGRVAPRKRKTDPNGKAKDSSSV